MNENLEPQLTSMEEMPTPAKKSRRWLWVVLGVLLVAVLAAAAFLGGRYLQKGALTEGGGGGPSLSIAGGPGGARTFRMGDMIPAEELPKTDPEVRGIFVSRQDNSLFVGTGQVTIMAQVDENGNTDSGSSYDGPKVEVVTTGDTQIYRDDTLKDLKELPSGEQVQQKVVPGSLDEVGENSAIQAWGKKVGDRLIADVLVYSQPQVFNAPVK